MSQIEPKRCALRLATGVIETCTGVRCAFWEPGGAVVEGGCLIERLGADVRQADLAEYLLETRRRLEQARGRPQAEAAQRDFSHRVGWSSN